MVRPYVCVVLVMKNKKWLPKRSKFEEAISLGFGELYVK